MKVWNERCANEEEFIRKCEQVRELWEVRDRCVTSILNKEELLLNFYVHIKILPVWFLISNVQCQMRIKNHQITMCQWNKMNLISSILWHHSTELIAGTDHLTCVKKVPIEGASSPGLAAVYHPGIELIWPRIRHCVWFWRWKMRNGLYYVHIAHTTVIHLCQNLLQ